MIHPLLFAGFFFIKSIVHWGQFLRWYSGGDFFMGTKNDDNGTLVLMVVVFDFFSWGFCMMLNVMLKMMK